MACEQYAGEWYCVLVLMIDEGEDCPALFQSMVAD